MVMCLYVTKFEEEFPSNITGIFKSYKLSKIKFVSIKNIKIAKIKEGNVKIGSEAVKFFMGKILYKYNLKDFSYSVSEELVDEITDTESSLSTAIYFIIFPDKKIILFNNRKEGKKYGKKILSQIFFNDRKKFEEVNFKPTLVLDAYKKGEFSDIWYNGVHGDSKITSINQYGSDFIDDPDFADKAGRYGVGVEIAKGTLIGHKVAVYESGVLNCLAEKMSIEDEIKARLELLNLFLKFS